MAGISNNDPISVADMNDCTLTVTGANESNFQLICSRNGGTPLLNLS